MQPGQPFDDPVCSLLQPDNPLWAPILLFFSITGFPTAGEGGWVCVCMHMRAHVRAYMLVTVVGWLGGRCRVGSQCSSLGHAADCDGSNGRVSSVLPLRGCWQVEIHK